MDSYFIFVTASLLLALTPGPDNLFVLTQSALYGKKAGLLITLGLCTGLFFHSSLVAFGLALMLQSSWGMAAIKALGACYLLFLAFKSFTAIQTHTQKQTQLSNLALYQRGIIMNVTNPKVSLFFLAFLPQFTSPSMGSFFSQVYLLGSLFVLVTLCVFGGIAYTGSTIQQRLERSPKIQLILNKVAGTVFILLALNLLV